MEEGVNLLKLLKLSSFNIFECNCECANLRCFREALSLEAVLLNILFFLSLLFSVLLCPKDSLYLLWKNSAAKDSKRKTRCH